MNKMPPFILSEKPSSSRKDLCEKLRLSHLNHIESESFTKFASRTSNNLHTD